MGFWRNWLGLVLVVVCMAPAGSPRELGPSKAMSQYLRDEWSAEQGFPGGAVHAIAQTPDGYLWIAAEKGLVRFDGLNFYLVQNSDSSSVPAGAALGLAVDNAGTMWVRLPEPKFSWYRDGKFQNVDARFQAQEGDVTAMTAGREGDILISGLVNRVVRYRKEGFETLVSGEELPKLVISVAQTADGKIWLGTRDSGLYCVDGKQISQITSGLPDKKVNSLLAIGGDELWIGTDNGVVRWNGRELSSVGSHNSLEHVQATAMVKDHNGDVWVGTSNGLIRVDARGAATRERGDEEEGVPVTALFEDREGNVWVGTTRGIERLRRSTFTTYSTARGLPSDRGGPIYVDPEGRTWIGPAEGGLYWLKGDQVGHVRDAGLDEDVVYSISGHNGELWIGRRSGGLTHLRYRDDQVVAQTFTKKDGLAQDSVYAVHESRDGTVWAGTLSAGLSRLKNDSFTAFSTANGLASNSIGAILESADGKMWFGTPNGVSTFANGAWRNYTSVDGLPPGSVTSLMQDSEGIVWIGTANGLAFFKDGAIQAVRGRPEALHEPIFGLEEDANGGLWAATANHIVRMDRAKLLPQEADEEDVREYGLTDGLRSAQGVNRFQSMAEDPLGRIWISTSSGLSFVDPKSVTLSSAPAMVHLNSIEADGRAFAVSGGLRIPSPHQRITLSYSGLSLTVPARVRFKYRLDGFDHDWSEATPEREATYTNLDPGSYTFHVVASNSEGVWNSAESRMSFEVEQVLWKTWWFRGAGLALFTIVGSLLVRMRMLSLRRRLNMRFEERLAERTRIAQELHDTLLQGFLSASMQLHVANDHLPAEAQAKPMVERVVELMERVVEESRNVVTGLRSSRRGFPELEQAFSRIREEFPVQSQIEYRVIVEGASRPMRPYIRDEVYLIGHEALSNAFRHSKASDIEVELEYATSYLRLLVRDNGSGIDPEVLRAGRDGHWGLSGMKERSERIGGKLRVLSHAAAGTEVELSVPGQVAFDCGPEGLAAQWFSKFRFGKSQHPKTQNGNGHSS
jgi:ligand-binding sensor domain-containing protein/signal transduction histidine kinase